MSLPRWQDRPARLAADLGYSQSGLDGLLDTARAKLLTARSTRSLLADDKGLAAWNGLMLSALAAGVKELHEPRYRRAGDRLRDYLVKVLWDGNRLHRAQGPLGPIGSAALEDYVYVAAGLADWARLSGSTEDQELAARLTADAWDRYYQVQGWRTSDELLIPGIAMEPAIADGPLPSPTALLIELSLRLDDPKLRAKALAALRLGYGSAQTQPFAYATHIRALLQSTKPEHTPLKGN